MTPSVRVNSAGTNLAARAAPHQPHQTTVSQIDQYLSGTDQMVPFGLAVKLTMPGIQRMIRTGMM